MICLPMFTKLFQSTPSYEGEHKKAAEKLKKSIFQSTPSYEGELNFVSTFKDPVIISIHSLIRGRTCFLSFWVCGLGNISIHSLIRGRTLRKSKNNNIAEYFNPLPHTRENQPLGTSTSVETISIHSLIRGRTSSAVNGTSNSNYFNPLPHTRENK